MSKNPTILVLTSTFPRWKNDNEPRFVYDLCQRLKNDFKIIVLSPHCEGSKKKENLNGLTIFRYRYAPQKLEKIAYEGGINAKLKINKLNYLILPFFFLGQWIAIIRLLYKFPIKVIHAHWIIPQAALALAARGVSRNKPAILCTSHGSDLYSLNDFISKRIKRYVLKKVEAITVVSTAMKKDIKRYFPKCTVPTVAPMGTDLQSLFTPDKKVKRNLNQLLFVGRLVEGKGLEYLLEALSKIVKKSPKVSLNIAGTGTKKAVFESQVKKFGIRKSVNFLGRLSHKELTMQYRTAQIAIFPFIKEGLGIVTIEALGCNCPVVVSDIPAVRDVVIDNETGLLFQPASVKELTEKINYFLKNPIQAQLLAKNGRKYVLEKFDWKIAAKNYIKILKGLV